MQIWPHQTNNFHCGGSQYNIKVGFSILKRGRGWKVWQMFALFDMTTRRDEARETNVEIIINSNPHSPGACYCGSCPGWRIESLTMSWRKTRTTQTQLTGSRRSTEDSRWILLISPTRDWRRRPLLIRTCVSYTVKISIPDGNLILLSSWRLTLPRSILTRMMEEIFCQKQKLRPCYCYSWPAVSWYCKQRSTEAADDC